jgi:hypothetical protein
MAEGDGHVFNNFKENVLLKTMNLASGGDVFKIILVNSGWTPTVDGAAPSYADVSANELSGTGYTAGGKTIGSQVVAQDDINNRASWDGADVVWTGLNAGTPAAAILYNDTVSDLLMVYWEVTTPTNGGDYTLQWAATGILLVA